jgi:hypothetical protein
MLTTNQSFVTYQGNGATTVFPYTFIIPSAASAVVSITNTATGVTTILSTSQYTITGIGSGSEFSGGSGPGGNVTYPVTGSPLPAGYTITIQRVVPYQQSTSLTNQGAFYPNVVEACLDILTMQTQQLAAVQAGVPAINSLTTATTQPNIDDSSNIATTAFVQNQKISGGTGYVNLQYPGYGVDPTGTNDSTTGIAAALATGYIVFAPPGIYKFGSSGILLNSIAAGGIIGAGPAATTFTSPDVSSNALMTFIGTGQLAPIFRDFTLQLAAAKIAGAGLYLNPATGNLSGPDIDNVWFMSLAASGAASGVTGLSFYNVSSFHAHRCIYAQCANGILINAAPGDADSGDSAIDGNCLFSDCNVGVGQYCSGGLKIIGNKFNTGLNAYNMSLNGSTSILIFEGNSVENFTGTAVNFLRPSGTWSFASILINGNEFSNNLNSVGLDASGAWSGLMMSGNTFNLAPSQYGAILYSVSGFKIGPNNFIGSGTGYGLTIEAACVNGSVDVQTCLNVSNPITNFSTGTFVAGSVGGTVTDAAAIVPTGQIFVISGTGTSVTLMAIPYAGWTGSVTMIPSATTVFATGGTQTGVYYPFGAGMTATVDVPIVAVFDGAHWWLK